MHYIFNKIRSSIRNMLYKTKIFIKNEKLLSLFFIYFLFLFIYTRFTNFIYRITFGWDQNQFSQDIWNLLINHKISLLGPRVNNDLGFFLAPYFTFILAPFYILTNMHPNALYIFVTLIVICFLCVLFYVLSHIFSIKHAIFIFALWSLSYVMQVFDIIAWWPIVIPIGSFASLFFIDYLYKNPKKLQIWILFGIVSGLFFHMHFQYILVIAINIFAIIYLYGIKKIKIIHFFTYLFSYALSFFPLLIFDLRHNFLNTRLFYSFFTSKPELEKDLLAFVPVLNNFLKPFLILDTFTVFVVFLIFCILSGIFLFNKSSGSKRMIFLCSSLLIVLTIIIFSYYGKRPSEYYFVFLLPYILINISSIFIYFKLEKVLIVGIFLLSILYMPQYNNNTIVDGKSIYFIDKTVQYLEKKIGKTGYNVSFEKDSNDAGFKYFFTLYDFKFTGNMEKDPLVGISVYHDKPYTAVFGSYAIYIPKKLLRNK